MNTLPALSESRPLRLTTVTAMYVAQGIQIGLLIVGLPGLPRRARRLARRHRRHASRALLLPWTLKLLYAPLMERYTFLAMGRRRPWMLARHDSAARSATPRWRSCPTRSRTSAC